MFRGEQAAIRGLYAAKIEATRRSVPAREVAAAIRALIEAQRAAMRAIAERRQANRAAARERRRPAPKSDSGASRVPPSRVL